MILDLKNSFEVQKARVYLEKLITEGCKIELTKKQQIRTLSQNGLLHVWFTVFAEFAGYESMEDCKVDIKRTILGQKPKFNKLTGVEELRDYETHLMTTKELSNFMDKFKIWAKNEFGCYLPYYGDAGYEDMINHYRI